MSKRKVKIWNQITLIIVILLLLLSAGNTQTVEFKNGIYPEITIKIDTFYYDDVNINGLTEKAIKINEVFIPSGPGNPDLPVITRLLNVPKGSNISYDIIESVSYKIQNIEIAPSPVIQKNSSNVPYIYSKNPEIYSENKLFPKDVIQFSGITDIRGIYTSLMGLTPFQYNPVKKELIVYKKLKFRIKFNGGTNYFEQRLRNPFFDNILLPNILNPEALKVNSYNSVDNPGLIGYEYIIITPDNSYFKKWADTLSNFRNAQGIKTGVYKISEIGGNTYQQIRAFIDNAYNSWEIPPVAVLILGDYGSNGALNITSGVYNSVITDNRFSDMNNDGLPDLILSRIPATSEADISYVVLKTINSERNPSESNSYYNKVVTALGWETTKWFQLCSEVIGGYLRNKLSKTTARINAVYNGNPGVDPWSSAENTQSVLNYFGPSGLNYIPATPQLLGGFSGGTGSMIVNEINSGSFFVIHRDHGNYSLWGEPYFNTSNIDQTTNSTPITVLSINCLTGGFAWTGGDCIAERFLKHSYNGNYSGAVSVTAASGESYSFYNDVYAWGLMDNLFPDFMPSVNGSYISSFAYPAFANAAGKYFLHQSVWVTDSAMKKETNFLFHHFGDAFTQFTYNVPTSISINHSDTIIAGAKSFTVNSEINTLTAISLKGVLLGKVFNNNGGQVSVPLSGSHIFGDTLKIVSTKQNKIRYENKIVVKRNPNALLNVSNVILTDPPPYGNGNGYPDYTETNFLTIKVTNSGLSDAINSTAILTTSDTNITITDSLETITYIASMNYVILNNAFKYNVKGSVPDNKKIIFKVRLNFPGNFTEYLFNYNAKAPVINYLTKVITDSTGNINRQVEPGEIGRIICPLRNNGNSISRNISAKLTSYSSYITTHIDSINYPEIGLGDSVAKFFVFSISQNAPINTKVPFKILYHNTLQNSIRIDSFNYTVGGSANVFIGTGNTQTIHPFPGNFTDARTQMIYTAAEILAGGGFSGYITRIGFKINTYLPSSFSNINVRVKPTNLNTLSGFENGQWHNCYSGPFSVLVSGIYHYINFSDIYLWDGQSNLIFEVCYDINPRTNNTYTISSNHQNMTYTSYLDDPFSNGCNLLSGAVMHYRPNIAIAINETIPVNEEKTTIPTEIYLRDNYPNPFNPATRILYGIPKSSFVTLKIYDILGRLIDTPVNQFMPAGSYSIDWNAENLTSGVYFYKLYVDNIGTSIKKMVLLK